MKQIIITENQLANIAKKLKKNKNVVKEGNKMNVSNYMFFGNLKTIKRLVDEMLEMDEAKVDAILLDGHNWAVDHIATSKDDIEEVANFIKLQIEGEDQSNINEASSSAQQAAIAVNMKKKSFMG